MVNLCNMKTADLVKLRTLLTPKLTKFIPHVPTPKQTAFLLLNNREAFYGGSAGGGKSDGLLMCGLQYVDTPGYAGIIFRRTYADLMKPGALIDRSHEWLDKWQSQGECRWIDKEKKWEFYTRENNYRQVLSTLQFGYMENFNDRLNYQGGEYQFIGFDELTHFIEGCYTYLFSRLRRLKGIEIPLRVRSASNPPDDNHGIWVKTRFIDEGPSHGRIFIPAGLDDNPYLDREEYEKSLDELDPVTRKRLRDGDWEIRRKGNMFRRDWFQVVNTVPQYRKSVRWWDMAASDIEKAKKKNRSNEPDYTVGLLLSEAQGVYYIEDIIRERMNPAGTEQLQKNTAFTDGTRVKQREEQEPGSSGIAITDNKKRTLFKGFDYEAIKSSGSKVDRALACSADAEHGLIKILYSCRNMEAFFDEAESFPGGIHDDMIDALSGALSILKSTPTFELPLIVSKLENVDSIWVRQEELTPGYFSSFGEELL